MAIDNKPLGLNHYNGLFSNVGESELSILSDKNFHEFDNQIPADINDCINLNTKKVGELISLNSDIDENTTTGDPFHLEGYFLDSKEFDIVEGLKKYRTVILETLFGYKIEMSVIGESHCLKITDKDNNIIASEIVACLPLNDVEHMYKLGENKTISIKKDGYDHKIIKFNSDKLGHKLGTKHHHGKDIFYSIQQDLIKFGKPQCSYDFPFDIEQDHGGVIHKIKTAGITAIKVFSVENKNEKKIITYSIHGYKKRGGLVYWDAPIDDSIIVTRSIFDLNILGQK